MCHSARKRDFMHFVFFRKILFTFDNDESAQCQKLKYDALDFSDLFSCHFVHFLFCNFYECCAMYTPAGYFHFPAPFRFKNISDEYMIKYKLVLQN